MSTPTAPNRILLVRLSSLGDVVRDVVVLASLRAAYPNATIDWAIQPQFADAIRHHPALKPGEIVPIDRSIFRLGNASALFRTFRSLRERKYDLVVDSQGLLKSGLLTRATRAPRRIGLADAREGAWLAYTDRIDPRAHAAADAREPIEHHVERRLALIRAMGLAPLADVRLYPGDDARTKLARDPDLGASATSATPRRYVLISPATRGLGRAWPVDRFAALVQHLAANAPRLNIDAIVIVGLANERDYCAPILAPGGPTPGGPLPGGPAHGGSAPGGPALRAGSSPTSPAPILNRIGLTTIPDLMALIERAALVVCNDSAAMHMTVAFNRPLVALLGPTTLNRAGPYGRRADVIQHRDAHEQVRHRDVEAASVFMERITIDEVIAACETRLS